MVFMTTVLNVKIDDKLKKDAQEAAKAIGRPNSTIVSASLREFVRTRSITISDTPRLKPEVEAELLALDKNIKNRKDLSPVFSDVDDAITWLKDEVKKQRV